MIANEFYLHPYSIAVRTFFRRQPSRYVIYNLGYECQICCVYSEAHIELFMVPGIIYTKDNPAQFLQTQQLSLHGFQCFVKGILLATCTLFQDILNMFYSSYHLKFIYCYLKLMWYHIINQSDCTYAYIRSEYCLHVSTMLLFWGSVIYMFLIILTYSGCCWHDIGKSYLRQSF